MSSKKVVSNKLPQVSIDTSYKSSGWSNPEWKHIDKYLEKTKKK